MRLVAVGLGLGVTVACSTPAPSEPVLTTPDAAKSSGIELYPGDQDLGTPGEADASAIANLFPKKLRSLEECPPDAPPDLEAQVAAGLVLPVLEQAVHGAFTQAKSDQVAYVVHVNPCNTSHAEGWGPTRIYVVDGGRKVAEGEGSHVTRVVDVDLDGTDELVVATGGIGQGILEESAKLLTFSAGKVRVMQDFGSVLTDDCGTRLPGTSSRVTRVLLTPGKGAVQVEKKVETEPCDID